MDWKLAKTIKALSEFGSVTFAITLDGNLSYIRILDFDFFISGMPLEEATFEAYLHACKHFATKEKQ